jgi:uncharacterized RDD family membrane protein YckC
MKCPKCGYLGFEHVERCRNCGYDFSLAPLAAVPDLPMRTGREDLSPLDDLSLVDAATAPPPPIAMADAGPDLDRMFGDGSPLRHAAVEKPSDRWMLFGSKTPDDEPLIKRASPPRPPLAVRRATPEVPRLRADQPRGQTLDLALEPDHSSPKSNGLTPGTDATFASGPLPHRDRTEDREENAAVAARFVAVTIDLLILVAIDLAVVYFTMQICGIALVDLDILPKGPLLAFLIVQNGGYLVAFTAGGQTLGKMAAGIRVVPTESASLDLGHAFLRTLMWFLLAVPAGLGFLTAFFGRDHRGLHDRFAGTRVVRASA